MATGAPKMRMNSAIGITYLPTGVSRSELTLFKNLLIMGMLLNCTGYLTTFHSIQKTL
jgi:hypothetical protein